jgi:hypothetical protein
LEIYNSSNLCRSFDHPDMTRVHRIGDRGEQLCASFSYVNKTGRLRVSVVLWVSHHRHHPFALYSICRYSSIPGGGVGGWRYADRARYFFILDDGDRRERESPSLSSPHPSPPPPRGGESLLLTEGGVGRPRYVYILRI